MEKPRHIGFEFKTITNLIMRNIDARLSKLADRDYTKMQTWIISFINEKSKESDVFQKDIEKEFKIRRSTATGILQLMEKNGYITKHAVDYDARLKKLLLTQKAIKLNEEIYLNINAFEEELESYLTEEEVRIFFEITAKLKKKLE